MNPGSECYYKAVTNQRSGCRPREKQVWATHTSVLKGFLKGHQDHLMRKNIIDKRLIWDSPLYAVNIIGVQRNCFRPTAELQQNRARWGRTK